MRTTLFGMEMQSLRQPSELAVALELGYLSSIDRIYLGQSVVDLGQGWALVHKETLRSKQLGRSYRTSVRFLGDQSANLPDSSIAKFHITPPIQISEVGLMEPETGEGALSQQRGQRLIATRFAKMVEELVPHELGNFCYIGPLRERPRRMYLSTGETPKEVGITGELGPAVLWSTSEAKQLNSTRLSEWCSQMGLALEIELAPVEGSYFRVLVIDAHTGLPINLPDVGFGTSQLLLILIQGLIATPGSTLMLEQPEIHLHPKVQADLADFLIEVSRREVGVIVETHSEHLINRLQRRIAEEALNSDDVALYFVTPSPEGSNLERVEIDEYGQIPNAPKGFFEEGFEEAFALARAVGGRKSARSQSGRND